MLAGAGDEKQWWRVVSESGDWSFGIVLLIRPHPLFPARTLTGCWCPFRSCSIRRIQDDALETGERDYITGGRYIVAENFLGLPAVTLPIGYDKDRLAIGLQFIGKPWYGVTLLHISSTVQGNKGDICLLVGVTL